MGLLCFWLWPTGQMLCVIFDEWLFHLLNGPLATNSTWLHVWAVASLRPFDAVVGVILLALLIRGDWVFKAVQVRQAFLASSASCCCCCLSACCSPNSRRTWTGSTVARRWSSAARFK